MCVVSLPVLVHGLLYFRYHSNMSLYAQRRGYRAMNATNLLSRLVALLSYITFTIVSSDEWLSKYTQEYTNPPISFKNYSFFSYQVFTCMHGYFTSSSAPSRW